MTYKIGYGVFGYYNDMADVDIIVMVDNIRQADKAEKIVREAIDAWTSADETEDTWYEGYLEGAERKLAEENIKASIYDKIRED